MSKATLLRSAADRDLILRQRAQDSFRALNRARAFDAAGGTSFAFLQSQLELLEPNPVKPLQAVTHPRDITVKNGGGFPEWISLYGFDFGGTDSATGAPFGLQATNNTELPEAQININKGLWPVFPWASSFTISFLDLKRMETAKTSGGNPPPFTLQQLYEQSIETKWVKALDYNTYKGFNGQAGLINNPNVPAVVVPTGGTGTAWSTKNPTQILTDINLGINLTVINSGFDIQNGSADTLLLPYAQWAALTQPMTIGGVGYNSALDYIKKNCVAAQNGIDFKIFPLPNPWISGTGLGGTDRGFIYRNNEDAVEMHVPAPKFLAYTIPTDKVAYASYYVGAVSSVVFKRTTTMCYLDGI
jgi:hypothetical protein